MVPFFIFISEHEHAASSGTVPAGLFSRMSHLLANVKCELGHTALPDLQADADAVLAQVVQILQDAPTKSVDKSVQNMVALQEEMELAWLTYQDEFAQPEADHQQDVEDERFATDCSLLSHHAAQSGEGFASDMGVAHEIQLDHDALMACLGLRGKQSLPFMNLHRHIKPYLVWTDRLPADQISAMIRQAQPPDFTLLALRWHQLVGICAAVRMLSKTGAGGILFADDVGIGKTSQTMGILALMMHRAHMAQQPTAPSGPLAGLPISVGPHIIVAPNSLINNWKAEGMMWLNVQVNFFVYEGSLEVRRRLLAPGSKWDQLTMAAYHRIILVPTSVSDTSYCEIETVSVAQLLP